MLEISLLINALEKELPGWSVCQPTIYDKAGPHFEMTIFAWKLDLEHKFGSEIRYYEPIVGPCETLDQCHEHLRKHFEAARAFFLQKTTQQTVKSYEELHSPNKP